MNTPKQELISRADQKINTIRRWAIFYWRLYNWCAVFSWTIGITVPFGLAIMLYIPEAQYRIWNIGVLTLSAIGLILQVISSTMRFRERALNGRHNTVKLESALNRYREGLMTTEAFIDEMNQFVESDYNEPGP